MSVLAVTVRSCTQESEEIIVNSPYLSSTCYVQMLLWALCIYCHLILRRIL